MVTLNATAACIWELLAHEQSEEQLTAVVAAQFEVDAAQARTDIRRFLDDIDRLRPAGAMTTRPSELHWRAGDQPNVAIEEADRAPAVAPGADLRAGPGG